jgi:hypothetical protein
LFRKSVHITISPRIFPPCRPFSGAAGTGAVKR